MKQSNQNIKLNKYPAIVMILVFLFIVANCIFAAEKNITVVEKSDNAKDETHETDNGTNLPAGSTKVEVKSLADACTKILAQLGPGDCIKELHFRGHGAPGNQSVGIGVNSDDAKEIDGVANPTWRTTLTCLQGRFCAGATIHLWGCNVGEGQEGANKLNAIANFFTVTAKGTVNKVEAGGQETYGGPIQTATSTTVTPTPVTNTDKTVAETADNDERKQSNIAINTGATLNSVAANPNAFTLNISNANILSYSEAITYPSCPPVTTTLISMTSVMTFSTNPNPSLISFFINNLSASTASYMLCGSPTGVNTYSLLGNYMAQGTINKTTGQILGSITYHQANSIGNTGFTNNITGNWSPSGTTMNLQFESYTNSGPSSAIPTLPQWGLIIFALLLITAGSFYLKKRVSF